MTVCLFTYEQTGNRLDSDKNNLVFHEIRLIFMFKMTKLGFPREAVPIEDTMDRY